MADQSDQFFQRNQQYVKPGEHSYNTQLDPESEKSFQDWVTTNKVPFDTSAAVSDYDMRGFYQALLAGDERARNSVNPNDSKIHYPDYWKTPFHESFSSESQWALPLAPKWNDQDQLVAPDGSIVFDERANTIANTAAKSAQNAAKVKAVRGK